MNKIQLSPYISLLLITIVASGATWLIVKTASDASSISDGYTSAQLISQGMLHASSTPSTVTKSQTP